MDTEELEKLAKLKDKGIITEEQFNQKKQEILGINNNGSSKNIITNNKKDNSIQNSKIKFFVVSALSFLLIWCIIVLFYVMIYGEHTSFLDSLIMVSLPLMIFCLLIYLNRKTYKKIIEHNNCERFIKNVATYKIVMLAITFLLTVAMFFLVGA